MSKAVARAGSLSPEVRLAQAVSEFEADLPSEEKSAFRALQAQAMLATPSPSDVMRLTAEFDRRMSKKFGSRCFGPRFTYFLQAVQQFAALGDVVIGGSQNLIACGVWSLVRMSLLVSRCCFLHFPGQLLRVSSRLSACRPTWKSYHRYSWTLAVPAHAISRLPYSIRSQQICRHTS